MSKFGTLLSTTTLGRALGVGGVAEVILPTPTFGATNLISWFAANQFTYLDDVGYSTVSAMEDLSGSGFGLLQGNKAIQPITGASGGPITNAAGVFLSSPFTGQINGLSKLSVWMRVKPRSDLYTGSAKRTLLAISEAAATATPPGSGSAVARCAIYASGGASNRKLYNTLSVKDGAQRSSSTTLGPQLSNDVFNTIGVDIDLTGASATINFYLNSLASTYNESWTPAEAAPWAFNTSDSVLVRVGDDMGSASPSYMEIAGIVILSDIPDATRRGLIKTYLDSLL